MNQEEGSNYFLDTINNKALLQKQKQRANPTFNVRTLASLP
jgi:hypothetical protein